MSEKLSEMYKLDRAIGLVTVASPVTQNLALLDIDEYLTADSLAVIHRGYINYIPVMNNLRRCKYISIDSHRDQVSTCILNLKWMKIECETFLVILSSEGLIIYDAEASEILYKHTFNTNQNEKGVIPLGSAVIGDFLCIGLSNGFVHLFKANEGHEFDYIHRVKLDEFLLCDGIGKYLIVATRQNIYIWEFNNCLFLHRKTINSERIENFTHFNKGGNIKYDLIRQIRTKQNAGRSVHDKTKVSDPRYEEMPFPYPRSNNSHSFFRVDAVPSVMKAVLELVIVGYENGELGLYSSERHKTLVKCEAHRSKVTAIDYSPLKSMVITSSLDHFIKVWQFNFTHSSISSIFSIETNYEICGVGFLNLRCTEFCVVKSNNVSVDVFVKVGSEYD